MKTSDRQRVFKKFNGKCAYCGNDIEYKNMQVDHLISKALNHHSPETYKDESGWHIPDPDRDDNLMPSCRRCNHYKRAHNLETFRRNLITLTDRLMKIYIFKVAIDYGIVQIKPFSGKFYFERLNNK